VKAEVHRCGSGKTVLVLGGAVEGVRELMGCWGAKQTRDIYTPHSAGSRSFAPFHHHSPASQAEEATVLRDLPAHNARLLHVLPLLPNVTFRGITSVLIMDKYIRILLLLMYIPQRVPAKSCHSNCSQAVPDAHSGIRLAPITAS